MPKQQTSIVKFINERKDNLAAYATREYSQREFLNSIAIAVQENTNLQKCLDTPEGQNSMYHALKLAAHTGLSLNPQMGMAALVPIKGKVTYQVMKNGLIELAMNSGNVKFLTSEKVHGNDQFEMGKSLDGDFFEHRPAKTDRGPVIGYYAALKMKDGSTHVKYMSQPEIVDHGQKYSFFYSDKSGPWQKSFDGMAIKTVIKALFRNLHISNDTAAAVGADDTAEQEILRVEGSVVKKGTSADDARAALEAQDEEPSVEPDPDPETREQTNGNDGDIF
jgi:recombination protein RecT